MAETWLGVAAAADRAGMHSKTILRALQKKQLRGYQRGPNGTWRIARADLDAWLRGEDPAKEGVALSESKPSLEDVRAWGATCDVPDAGAALGIGRNKAYELVKKDQFPVKVLKVGASYRVVTSDLVRFLSGQSDSAPEEHSTTDTAAGPKPAKIARRRADGKDYTVRVHVDDSGEMWAEVVDMPGCFAAGSTWAELGESIGAAVDLYARASERLKQN